MDDSCVSQGPQSVLDGDIPSRSVASIQHPSNPLALIRPVPLASASFCPSVELSCFGDSIPFDKEPAELEIRLQTSAITGLTDAEARHRLALWGQNVMKGQRRYTWGSVLWKQVSNAMTVILVGCLIIAFATMDYSEGGVIAGSLLEYWTNMSVCCCQHWDRIFP